MGYRLAKLREETDEKRKAENGEKASPYKTTGRADDVADIGNRSKIELDAAKLKRAKEISNCRANLKSVIKIIGTVEMKTIGKIRKSRRKSVNRVGNIVENRCNLTNEICGRNVLTNIVGHGRGIKFRALNTRIVKTSKTK